MTDIRRALCDLFGHAWFTLVEGKHRTRYCTRCHLRESDDD